MSDGRLLITIKCNLFELVLRRVSYTWMNGGGGVKHTKKSLSFILRLTMIQGKGGVVNVVTVLTFG